MVNQGKFIRTDTTNPDFISLVSLLDADLAQRDGTENAFYIQFNGMNLLQHCMVYYQNQHPVACGALKIFDEDT